MKERKNLIRQKLEKKSSTLPRLPIDLYYINTFTSIYCVHEKYEGKYIKALKERLCKQRGTFNAVDVFVNACRLLIFFDKEFNKRTEIEFLLIMMFPF